MVKDPIPVLPIYHGKGSYTSTTYLFDLFCENKELAENIFLKPFTLIEVSKIPDDELMRYPYSGTVEFIFKHIFAREILVFLEKIKEQLRFLEGDRKSADLLTSIFKYVIIQGESEEKTKITNFIKDTFSQQRSKKMANIATQFWQEGRQEGDFERSCKVALKMLRKNLPISEIADFTELSVRQINALKRKDLSSQSEN